jgi:tetratricopeptide (TPR) repeat protein
MMKISKKSRLLILYILIIILFSYHWRGKIWLNLGLVNLVRIKDDCLDKSAVKKDLTSTQIDCSTTSILISNGVDNIKQSLSWQPDCGSCYRYLFLSYKVAGKTADAEDAIFHAVELNPTEQLIQFYVANWYFENGNIEKAVIAWRVADAYNYLVNIGKLYLDNSDFNTSEQYLKLAVMVSPNLPKAYIYLGMSQRGLGKKDLAALAFHRASLLENMNMSTKYYYDGLAYWLEGNYSSSIEYYMKAIDNGKSCGTCYFDLGAVWFEIGDLDDAAAILRTGAQQIPTDYFIKRLLGDVYRQKGECQEALYWYREAISIDPDTFSPWMGRGMCFYSQEEYAQAIESLNIALSNRIEDFDVYYWLGKSYFNLGEYQEAIGVYENGLSIIDNYQYHLALGETYEKLGESNFAIEQYQKVLEMDTGNETALQRLRELKH